MRQRTLISALVFSMFFAVSLGISGVYAAEIFINKNKDMPAKERPRSHVFTLPKISVPPAPTAVQPPLQVEPQAIPQYTESQQPVAPASPPPQMKAGIDQPICTREDAEKIIKFDREFFKNLGDLETKIGNFEDPNFINALTDLYIRCGNYLNAYKEARGEPTEPPEKIKIKPVSNN